MPLWLIAALVLGGGLVLLERAPSAPSPIAPTGRRWPAGVSAADAAHAVAIALQNETDPGALRDFARQIGPYDLQAFDALNAKAASLQASTEHVVSTVAPAAPPAVYLSSYAGSSISPLSGR